MKLLLSENSPRRNRRGGGGVVRVLSGSCGNREDYIEMLTCEDASGRVEENVIFKVLCDGSL